MSRRLEGVEYLNSRLLQFLRVPHLVTIGTVGRESARRVADESLDTVAAPHAPDLFHGGVDVLELGLRLPALDLDRLQPVFLFVCRFSQGETSRGKKCRSHNARTLFLFI